MNWSKIIRAIPIKLFGLNLPTIPKCRKWKGMTTPEQDALMKIQFGKYLNEDDIENLEEGYKFLIQAIERLKCLDLHRLKRIQILALNEYMKTIFNLELMFQDTVDVGLVFRMIWIKDFNQDDGKVRNPQFLSCTPLEIVKSNKCYGRANSDNSTCLYLAETAQAAVFECKPNVGDRIIITGWAPKGSIKEYPTEVNKFQFYMINSSDIVNPSVERATRALKNRMDQANNYFARLILITQQFIGQEFIKDMPIKNKNKYEYYYSAFFADKVLNGDILIDREKSPKNLKQYDGIMYPSVANKYKYSNIAIKESSISRLEPRFCNEYLVEKTFYDNFDGNEDHLPIAAKEIRHSISIKEKIIWNDDQ